MDLATASIDFQQDYLFAKIQAVHRVMVEIEGTQEEMKVKPL